MFKIDDIVKFKAEPNSGEMVVVKITPKYLNFPNATLDNPVIHCKYWNGKESIYYIDQFYFNNLKKV